MEKVFIIEGEDLQAVRRSISECLQEVHATTRVDNSQENILAIDGNVGVGTLPIRNSRDAEQSENTVFENGSVSAK